MPPDHLRPIRHGGLMRCCLATVEEEAETRQVAPTEGETLDCKYEAAGNQNLIFRDGYWEWNRLRPTTDPAP